MFSCAELEDRFLSWPLKALAPGTQLPGNIYICVGHKFVRFRNADDLMTSEDFDRLLINRVGFVFIRMGDYPQFRAWTKSIEAQERKQDLAGAAPEQVPIIEASREVRRTALDLFQSPSSDEAVQQAVTSSKALVTQFMEKPFALSNFKQLQKYGRGLSDHSVNVSVLSVFLGLRMGYTSQPILEHLALGALFHDIGKVLLKAGEGEAGSGAALTGGEPLPMEKHPEIGEMSLEKSKQISKEVKLIVHQHHEFFDGTGYPQGLKANSIYDLARLVAIANIIDNIITETPGEMKARIAVAISKLETDYQGKLDPKKLEKVIRILKSDLA